MKTTNSEMMKSNLKPFWMTLCAATVAASCIGLSACNTVEGVGRDVESAGDAVADTANDAKH